MAFCTSIKITDVTTGKITENYHQWYKQNGPVCGDISWTQVSNEDIKMMVWVENLNTTSQVMTLSVDWNETVSGITTTYNDTRKVTASFGITEIILKVWNSATQKYRQYQPNTKYEFQNIKIDDVKQFPSEPTKVCNIVNVVSGAPVPTVTTSDVTFAYEDPIDCTALDSNCEETITAVSGKHVSAKLNVTCSASAKFKLKMVYVDPAGVTKTVTTTQQTQPAGTRGYCVSSANLWQVGSYTALSVTAIDITAG